MNIKCDSKLAVHVRAAASINNIDGKNVHCAFCNKRIGSVTSQSYEVLVKVFFRAQVLFRNIVVLAYAYMNRYLLIILTYFLRSF